MPRGTKQEEMTKWLKGYRYFAVKLNFITYSTNTLILAPNMADAQSAAAEEYPGIEFEVVGELTGILIK